MDIQLLKEYILDNDYIPIILENLGCHHIKKCDEYFKCGNPDGDNVSSITVYTTDNISVVDYTRKLSDKKVNDIFDLVMFFTENNFFKALNLVCEWCDIDYYKDWEEDLPESLKLTKMIMDMQSGDVPREEEVPLKPISEHILKYYYPYVNDMFAEDNISYSTQRLFEIGYDDFSQRVTIPIRDEIGNLVGVKGRDIHRESDHKYLYLENCRKSQLLYGLYQNYDTIQKEKCVYVTESEKGVLQLHDMGYNNAVATLGKTVSNMQIAKLTRLCVKIVLCFDKDVQLAELEELATRFIDGVELYALLDLDNILDEKESPTDNPVKFKHLVEDNMILLK